ncbi:hypothetical protein Tco_0081988, partial [Tanacetum coccineum]
LQSLNIKRSLKRPGADLEQASSKKSKPNEAPQSSVPDESQQPSVEVTSQKATIEDVEVSSNTASTAQHTASLLKKAGTRKKRKLWQVLLNCGVGLVLWGDLKVLMDSPEVNDVGGLVVHMFVDKKYPLSVNLIEQMLDHQLEICHDTVGNELTTAVQLIAFLKK